VSRVDNARILYMIVGFGIFGTNVDDAYKQK